MKTKSILFICFFSLTICLWGQSVSLWQGGNTVWTNGAGSSSDPFLIESAEQLAYLAVTTNSGTTYSGVYFKLMVDIDLNGYNWTPIGNSSSNIFQGIFDGNNYSIYQLNMLVSGSGTNYVGLFGNLSGATLSKIKIKSGAINLSASSLCYVGCIAGYASESNIDSCGNEANIVVNNRGTTTSYNSSVGGLVGYMTGNSGDLTNSYNKGQVNFTITLETTSTTSYNWYNYIGGLVGYLYYSDIINCANLNQLTAMNDVTTHAKNSRVYLGGVAGHVYANTSNPVLINRTYNRGKLTLNNKAYSSSSSYSSYAYGYVGGIAGYHNSGYITISNCYNRGDIEPNLYSYSSSYNNYSYAYVSGITGYMASTITTFSNCYQTGAVPSTYTPYNQDAGSGSKPYYHSCYAYNPSTITPTIGNCYFLNSCGCTSNSNPYASPVAEFILKSQGMPSTLGSTDWSRDANPVLNDGYPILLGGIYPSLLTNYPVSNITSLSFQANASLDTLQVNLSNCSEVGFEYKLTGSSTYSIINCDVEDAFSTIIGGLQPCTTYTYRPYAIINGYTVYGDTSNVTLLCLSTSQIDTILCPGDTLQLFGDDFYPNGTYYKIDQNVTYRINLSYYPSRNLSIDTIIYYGDTLFINNQPYYTSGINEIRFSPDGYGCDSVVNLTLRLQYQVPSVWDGTTSPWVFGNGTAQMPYLIENAAQLAYMASEINTNAAAYVGSYFELVADIDLNGYNWTPIGNSSANSFQGYFDGNHHSIDNLNITVNGNNPQYIGLFGYVSNAEVSNIHIIGNGLISVRTTNTNFYIGSIVGYAIGSTIDSCTNTTNIYVDNIGTTTNYNTYLGGLVGYLTGNTGVTPGVLSYLTNSLNQGKINFAVSLQNYSSTSYTWRHYIGGGVGYLSYATIDNCGNLDSIILMNDVTTAYKNSYIYGGGMVGYMTGNSSLPGSVRKTYNIGKIVINNKAACTTTSYNAIAYAYIGGIAGYTASGYITITDCYNRGDIYPNVYSYSSSYYNYTYTYVAGISGYIASATTTMTNCYNIGNVPSTFTPYAGDAGTGTNSYSHDCFANNGSVVTNANNNYYQNDCECLNNTTNASPTSILILRANGMPVILNQGSPGSGIWKSDVDFINDGYPIFAGENYPQRVITLPAENITALSAQLIGRLNTFVTPLSAVTQVGFEYKLKGTSTYTSISCAISDSFAIVANGMQPCSTYTYRAYVVVNQHTFYGDTLEYTLLCQSTNQIDTTLCPGDTLVLFGTNFYPNGTYYKIDQNITYTINLNYYQDRALTIDTIINYGDTFYVNNQPFYTSGIYTIRFSPNGFGCDSVVYLTLRLQYNDPSIWDGTSTPWVFGNGTAQMPYLIENAAQLAYMASEINTNAAAYVGSYFELVADIDLNGYNWTPIGNSSNPFQGHFDGNHHTIGNLNINVSGNNPAYVGLFGNISEAEISNIQIIGNGVISVRTTNTTFYIGSIVGYAHASTIDSCSNTSDIYVNNVGTTINYNTYIGGLVGYLTGNANITPGVLSYLTNSFTQGKIDFAITLQNYSSSSYTWRHYVGGVVGAMYYATIDNCGKMDSLILMNDVTTAYKNSYVYSGGVAGYLYGTSSLPITIRKAYNSGHIIINNKAASTSSSYYANAYAYVGGITGYCATGYITVTDCYNRGNIQPNVYSYNTSYYNRTYTYVAGVASYLTSSTITITNCYVTGNVPSTYTAYAGDAGSGYKEYNHDCIAYNVSTYTRPNNNYYIDNCECTNNATNAFPTPALTLQDQGMPIILNQGTPGSGIWKRDLSYINGGYPIFEGGSYPSRVTTFAAEDITSLSARAKGVFNTLVTPLSAVTAMGFEYKLQGTSNYLRRTCTIADSFSLVIGGLQSCSTYTFRAFAIVNQNTFYGDTLEFTLLCDPAIQIDTTICYGDTFSYLGYQFYPSGVYYLTHQNYTHIVNVQYYIPRESTIYAQIPYGDSYWVNGNPYTASGNYQIRFAPDIYGCDSIVNLTLRVVYSSPDIWDGTTTPWVFGDGTAQMPYQIENAAQLAYMASEINSNASAYVGRYFELVSDIDLNGYNWTPIGNNSSNAFQGYFDGNHHTIDNLNITVNGNNPQYVGLFGYLSQAEVSNIDIIGNGVISVSTNNTTFYVGSIAGYALGSIIDSCSNTTDIFINNTATTSAYNTYVGGIVGNLAGNSSIFPEVMSSLTNTLNQGKINFSIILQTNSSSSYSWRHYVGGLAGALSYATIDNCGNLDSIILMNDIITYYKTSYVYCGGITGYITASSSLPVNIRKAYNKGDIILNNKAYSSSSSYYANAYGYIGGIAGYCSTGYTTITDCYNRGNLQPNVYSYSSSYYNRNYTYVGGITSYLTSSTITVTNCYNTGNVPSTYTPYLGNAGTGTKYYYHDCFTYNASTVTNTNNNYYQNDCGCVDNVTNAFPTIAATLKDQGMPLVLNQGSPGSGIWKRDIAPMVNDGYPIFEGGRYPQSVLTLLANNITNASANLNGWVDTNLISLSDITNAGFEYNIHGSPNISTVNTSIADSFFINVGGLQSCTDYDYRAFVVSGGNTVYGAYESFTTTCFQNIDTTVCHGTTLTLFGQNFTQQGNYHVYIGNYTYNINIANYPYTEDTITMTICQGQSCLYHGSIYTNPGYYNNINVGTTIYGCDSIVTLHVIQSVDIAPVINISGGDVPACAGSIVPITASGGVSYLWSSNESTATISAVAGNSYTVYGYNSVGCSSSATITIPTKPSPDVEIDGVTTICEGTNTTLIASGADSYEWSTGAITNSITVSPIVQQTYWVRGAYQGCYDSTSITIDIQSMPIITIQGDTNICNGEQTMLIANGGTNYQWSTGATTSAITVSPNQTTVYSVSGSNSLGCNKLQSITIHVSQPAISGFIVSSAVPYLWNGQTYASSGIYTQTFPRLGQCDSVVTLNLTITSSEPIPVFDTVCFGDIYADYGFNINTADSLPGTYNYNKIIGDATIQLSLTILSSSSSSITHTICQGSIYNQHGFNIDSDTLLPGTYTYHLNYPVLGACDSIVTLNLTVTTAITATIYDSICFGSPYYSENGYTILGLRDSLPGNYSFSKVINVNGCDSTTILILTLLNPAFSYIQDTICQGQNYNENGFVLITENNSPGNYQYSRIEVNGSCVDSVFLNLVIKSVDTLNITASICQGESYSDYGFNSLTSAGTYTGAQMSPNGCSTIVNLTLQVNPIYTTYLNDVICKGAVYAENGFVVRTSTLAAGTYTYNQHLQSSHGCDSTVSLTLTVNPIIRDTINATVCQGTPYVNFGFGVLTDTLNQGVHSFSQNLYTLNGCDSIVVLQLLVNSSYSQVLYDTIQQGINYNSYGFSNLTSSGVYVQSLLSTSGCDSIITLYLTVLTSTDVVIHDTICQGDLYSNYGFRILTTDSTVGTYMYSRNMSNFVFYLHLTILSSGSSEWSASVCTGSLYNGYGFSINTDTLSEGTHTFTQSYAVNPYCDSLVTLHLTVLPTLLTDLYDSVCYGMSYYNRNGFGIFGLNDSLPGAYQYTRLLQTGGGCDSMVILHLTISPANITHLQDSICVGDDYTSQGFTLITRNHLPGTYLYKRVETNSGCIDSFYLHLTINPIETLTVSASICQGESYTGYGFIGLTSGGSYSGTLASVNGCDTIVHLTLNVLPIYQTDLYDAICKGGVYSDNDFVVRTSSYAPGTYTYNKYLQTSAGCDSNVTLYLTINPVITDTIDAAICQGTPYLNYGFGISTDTLSSGVHTYSRQLYTGGGCDSVVVLNLDIHPTYSLVFYDTLIQGSVYNANGFSGITTQGTHQLSISTDMGCDSIITLYLTVLSSNIIALQDTVCQGDLYSRYGFSINTTDSTAGTYEHIGTIGNNQLSLHLTILSSGSSEWSASVCTGSLYNGYGFSINTDTLSEGTHTFTQSYAVNPYCDSLVTLHLTVLPTLLTDLYDSVCYGMSYYNRNGFGIFGLNDSLPGAYQYTRLLQTGGGCDSMVILHLTIFPADITHFQDSICVGDDYTAQGFTLITRNHLPGTYLYKRVETNSGCIDSFYLHLTINPIETLTVSASICQGESYTGYGFIGLTSGGSYSGTLASVNGCDTIVHLTLNVLPIYQTDLYDAICKGGVYSDNDFVVRTSSYAPGTYTYNKYLQTSAGCDSNVTLYLTINPVITDTIDAAICQGTPYLNYGFGIPTDTLSSGVHTYSRQLYTGGGCDSVVVLNLDIHPTYSLVFYDTLIQGSVYNANGFNGLTTQGTHQLSLSTDMGCDSIITLHLTVLSSNVVVLQDTVCQGDIYNRYGFSINTTDSIAGTYEYIGTIGNNQLSLHLTILSSGSSEWSASVCTGSLYNGYGFSINTDTLSEGTHTFTQSYAVNPYCDSLVTLHLTVLPTLLTDLYDSVCYGMSYYNRNGFGIFGLNDSLPGAYQYTRLLQTGGGCDSMVILHLTISPANITHLQDSICVGDDYTSQGFTLITRNHLPGTYLYKRVETNSGCIDSFYLHLTINPIETLTVSASICQGESYTGYGFIGLTSGGSYSGTLASVNGCDTIVHLTLNVLPIYQTDLYDAICKGGVYSDNDFVVRTSSYAPGTYTYNKYLQTSAGCDSNVTLYLTINPVITDTIDAAICQGTPYLNYGFGIPTDTLSSGVHTYSRQLYTDGGCDSIVVLNLDVHPTYSLVFYDTIIQGSVYNANGFSGITTQGTHQLSLSTDMGCDSIITLYLTVLSSNIIALQDTVCQGDIYSRYGFSINTTDSIAGTYEYIGTIGNNQLSLHLTILSSGSSEWSASVCTGSLYNGYGFSINTDTLSEGTHTFTQSYAVNPYCDSLVTLHLTVLPTLLTDLYDSVCYGMSYYNRNGFGIFGLNDSLPGAYQYTRLLQTGGGCDSMVILHLTISPANITHLQDSICVGDDYTSQGFTLITRNHLPGTYLYKRVETNSGCIDSFYLHLTINPIETLTVSASICQGESYTGYGFIGLTSGGSYSGTLASVNGCDTIVHLTLNVLPIYQTDLYDAICKGGVYSDNDFVVRTSSYAPGTYTYNKYLQTSAGCDSNVTLYLTINPVITDTIDAAICQGTPYLNYGFGIPTDTLSSGVHTYSRQLYTGGGCDSVVVLNLDIHPTYSLVFYDTLIQGSVYNANGFNGLTTQGTHQLSLSTDMGCDSIITLHLTVLSSNVVVLQDTVCQGDIYNRYGFSINTTDSIAGTYEYIGTIGNNQLSLHLTILSSGSSEWSASVCTGSLYNGYGFSINTDTLSEGTHTFTQSYAVNPYCDSLVTLHLTVLPTLLTDLYDSVCYGMSYYNRNGFGIFGLNDSLPGAYQYTRLLQTGGGCDSMVILHLTISPANITHLQDSICVGDDYTSQGFTLITRNHLPGTYLYKRVETNSGCIDSFYLHLTINPIETLTVSASICQGESYTGYGFIGLTSGGSYSGTLASVNGCDTIVHLTLNVLPIYQTDLYDAICKGGVYSDNDFVVRTSSYAPGTYTYNKYLQTSAGCDSNVTLYLTINPVITDTIDAAICQGTPYLNYGFGIPTDTLSSGVHTYSRQLYTDGGCDSIVVLNLDVHPTYSLVFYDTIIQGSVYNANGFSGITTQGTHQLSLSTDMGCDSIITLYLTVLSSNIIALQDTVCQGDIYSRYGFSINTTDSTVGTYEYQNSIGDNVVSLQLTILSSGTSEWSVSVCTGSLYNGYGFVINTDTLLSGTHTFTQSYAVNPYCDSVVTLHLTVLPTILTDLYDSVCYGMSYYNSNGFGIFGLNDSLPGAYQYTRLLQTGGGCDSMVILHLTIFPADITHFQDSICVGDDYTAQGFTLITRNHLPGTYLYKRVETNSGCIDSFYLHLTINPIETLTVSASICQGESYTGYGFIGLTSGGSYSGTLASVNGCDTIVHLTLNVLPIYQTDLYDAICKGGVYSDNDFVVRTSSYAPGTYTYNKYLQTSAGCDSNVTLYLTINPVITDTIDAAICQGTPYLNYGFGISTDTLSSGVHTYSRQLYTGGGCDSVVILNLQINTPSVTTLMASVCQGDLYNNFGFNISTEGLLPGTYSYSQQHFNQYACDSTVILNLTVNEKYITELHDEICQGVIYQNSGFNINTETLTPGFHVLEQSLITQNGCDSIVRLTLKVNRVDTTILQAVICAGESYMQYGFNESSTGIYQATYLDATGCDSVVILNLTVSSSVTANIQNTDILCHGMNNGTITVMPDGGTAPYSVSIFASGNMINPIREFTQVPIQSPCTTNNLISGTYYVMVRDVYGCEYTTITQLTQPEMLSVSLLSINHVSCYGLGDGTATIGVQGGTTPYNYLWSNGNTTNSETQLSAGYYSVTITDAQGCSAILPIQIQQPSAITTEINISACDQYTWNQITYNYSGRYMQSLVSSLGCDSTVYLNLTLTSTPISMDTIVSCDSFSWYGTQYYASGIYTHIIPNADPNGCESILRLNLTILNATTNNVYQTSCDSFVWFSEPYYTTGTYTKVLPNANSLGCDSILILHLSILNTTQHEIYQTVCDSYTWPLNGQTYTNTGDYFTTLFNSQGCDSIVVLHLIVNQATSGEVFDTSCVSYNWNLSGQNYNQSGDYQYTIINGNSHGCDSIVTLHLVILQPSEGELYQTSCSEFRWDLTSSTYYDSGDYTAVIPNHMGCDSVITLHLIINQPILNQISVITSHPYYWDVTDETYDVGGVYSHTYYGAAENGCDSTVNLTLIIENDTTSIDNSLLMQKVVVYPNPTQDEIHVTTEGDLQITHVALFDIYGNRISIEKNMGDHTVFSLRNYASGVYLIRLMQESKYIGTVKVIKQ